MAFPTWSRLQSGVDLPGNRNGTYTEGAAPSIQGPTSYPFVSADFNGDGIPDLVVPLYGSNEIAILREKGMARLPRRLWPWCQAPMSVSTRS